MQVNCMCLGQLVAIIRLRWATCGITLTIMLLQPEAVAQLSLSGGTGDGCTGSEVRDLQLQVFAIRILLGMCSLAP